MIVRHSSARVFLALLALLVIPLCWRPGFAQDDPANGETDPIKLFERGQDAHAKNDYKKAIELYEAAIKIKPEFPEAEFQRAMALLFTNRKAEALEGFNRAVALRPDWAMAYSKFGSFLGSYGNDPVKAEPILRRAIELDPKDDFAMTILAENRANAGDVTEGLKLIRSATFLPTAKSSTWRKRAFIETLAGDKLAAALSLDHALTIDPNDLGALYDRARVRLDTNNREGALADLHALERAGFARELAEAFEYAQLYARADDREDALRVLDALPEKDRSTAEVIALRAEIAGGDGSSAEERAALEEMLVRDPKNASLLARLGNAYRKVDPWKSQDYYYRALQIEPKNAKYAIGYAGALVQGRRFAEAETVLRRVLAVTPDDYTAHANLALALSEMKRFAEAIPEYEWLVKAKPEIAATYFFIAIAHDNLAEYPEALDAYQKFLAHADPATNKLEIDKANLRLPTLRAQIQRGQGVKRKNP
jgi:tetratricopeptide (TPR) repeat protein